MRRLRTALSGEEGSASVEAVLWLPLFFLALGLMTDATMVFHGYTQALSVLQDANRALSVGRLDSTAETEAYVEAALTGLTPRAVATSGTSAGVVTTTVVLPAADLQVLGFFENFNTLTLTVSAQHVIES